MPYGDGTGPAGMGPMTGRAAGYCAGYPVPGYMNPIPGRGFWGFGRGRFGRGRGFRHWYYATGLPGWMRASMGFPAYRGYIYPPAAYPFYGQEITPGKEAEILKEQAKAMQEELKSIQERISILEKAAQEKE